MAVFTFFVFEPKTPLLGKFGPKVQNSLFKAKLVPRLIRIYKIQC